jgi:hypothetical protein
MNEIYVIIGFEVSISHTRVNLLIIIVCSIIIESNTR